MAKEKSCYVRKKSKELVFLEKSKSKDGVDEALWKKVWARGNEGLASGSQPVSYKGWRATEGF